MRPKYVLELTETAEKVYSKLYEEAQECLEAGDPSNSKVTLFRMVEEAVNQLIPQDPFHRNRALSGPLSNIFRVSKGRIRICYVASSKHRRIVILYISETLRKEGDVRDPYSIFTRMVLSGQFDQIFELLGIRKPSKE